MGVIERKEALVGYMHWDHRPVFTLVEDLGDSGGAESKES